MNKLQLTILSVAITALIMIGTLWIGSLSSVSRWSLFGMFTVELISAITINSLLAIEWGIEKDLMEKEQDNARNK